MRILKPNNTGLNNTKFILKIFFLAVILYGYFYNVKFSYFNVGTLYIFASAIIVLGFGGRTRRTKASPIFFTSIASLYIASALAIVSYSINFPDADYFLAGALFLLATVGMCSFRFFDLFSRMAGQPLLSSVIVAVTFNAILMLVMFLSPSVQLGYLSFLSEDGFEFFGGRESALESMHRFRMIGASGFATYSTAFIQTIGLFFLAVYYFVSKRKPDVLFLVLSVLVIVSAVLSARSSFLGIFLWIIFCFIFFQSRFVVVFFCSFIFLVVTIVLLNLSVSEVGNDFFINWLLELFTSGTSSESLTETVQMLDTPFMDSGLYGFSRWYGDLGYDYFRSADVGFIRLILAGGFVTFSFVVLHFVLLGLLFFRGTNIVFFRTLYCFLMVYFFIIMFKGAIIFDFFAFDFLMLMLAWIANQNKSIVKIT